MVCGKRKGEAVCHRPVGHPHQHEGLTSGGQVSWDDPTPAIYGTCQTGRLTPHTLGADCVHWRPLPESTDIVGPL
jgi:hypothetical protein